MIANKIMQSCNTTRHVQYFRPSICGAMNYSKRTHEPVLLLKLAGQLNYLYICSPRPSPSPSPHQFIMAVTLT